ncbi:hypothetical protein [Robertmurraya kyonggiensis]|uniref:hypothetical protein n=1 Tax=Robertmurraya kyonggiensis TaxID=1037680 RepID=UPI00130D89FC|nr:hypothetical protein [Robertmurraya kyonggiensis]
METDVFEELAKRYDTEDRLSEVGFISTDIRTFHHGNRIFMNQDASMFICNSCK